MTVINRFLLYYTNCCWLNHENVLHRNLYYLQRICKGRALKITDTDKRLSVVNKEGLSCLIEHRHTQCEAKKRRKLNISFRRFRPDSEFTLQSIQISSVGYGILLRFVISFSRFIRPCMSKICFRYLRNC